MKQQHVEHPDLEECLLEDRVLPASFLETTYFEPPPYFGAVAGIGNNGLGGAASTSVLQQTYLDSYNGFGSNPFGTGLSPLSGVVAAYSQNTALSEIFGAGSTLPIYPEVHAGVHELPVAAAPRAVAVAMPGGMGFTGLTGGLPGTLAAPVRNYGSAFSSGFSFGINSANNWGMGSKLVGSLIASQYGYSESYPGLLPPRFPGNVPGGAPGAGIPGTPPSGAPRTPIPGPFEFPTHHGMAPGAGQGQGQGAGGISPNLSPSRLVPGPGAPGEPDRGGGIRNDLTPIPIPGSNQEPGGQDRTRDQPAAGIPSEEQGNPLGAYGLPAASPIVIEAVAEVAAEGESVPAVD